MDEGSSGHSMTALLDHLDELDRLVHAARKNGMQSDRFISESAVRQTD
jgi:hypothetical protein